MAPGTTIGAATPIDLQGGDVPPKVINDAASYAETIARLRGRDPQFAVDAVREGRSVTAEEAVTIGAVDLLAGSRAELLEAIDGMRVRVAGDREVTLSTREAWTVRYEMGPFRRVLQWLADPTVAFLFLSIGTLAILYELANPGIGAGGIVGAIMLLLGLFSLSVLPVNVVGVILLVLAAGLFLAELFAPGIGVFAAGGTVSLLLGGLFLFRGSVAVDPVILLPAGIVVGGGTVVAGRLVWRARRAPSPTGPGAVVGRWGDVRAAEGASGWVLVDGVWWKARSRGDPLAVGQRVRITDMDGLELIVERGEGEA